VPPTCVGLSDCLSIHILRRSLSLYWCPPIIRVRVPFRVPAVSVCKIESPPKQSRGDTWTGGRPRNQRKERVNVIVLVSAVNSVQKLARPLLGQVCNVSRPWIWKKCQCSAGRKRNKQKVLAPALQVTRAGREIKNPFRDVSVFKFQLNVQFVLSFFIALHRNTFRWTGSQLWMVRQWQKLRHSTIYSPARPSHQIHPLVLAPFLF
jgi:hypothetical protein